jgi:hypothetical protein
MKLYAWFHAKHDSKSVDYEGDHVVHYESSIVGPAKSFQEIFDGINNWNNGENDERHWEIVAIWNVDEVSKSALWTLNGITQGIVISVKTSSLDK